jgi:hypothetical protein
MRKVSGLSLPKPKQFYSMSGSIAGGREKGRRSSWRRRRGVCCNTKWLKRMVDGGWWMVSVTMSCDVGFWRALPCPVKPPIGQADPCAASPAQPSPRCSGLHELPVYPHCQRPKRQRIKSRQLSFITPYLECALKISAA